MEEDVECYAARNIVAGLHRYPVGFPKYILHKVKTIGEGIVCEPKKGVAFSIPVDEVTSVEYVLVERDPSGNVSRSLPGEKKMKCSRFLSCLSIPSPWPFVKSETRKREFPSARFALGALQFSRSVLLPVTAVVFLFAVVTNTGCSVKKFAIGKIGSAIASGGTTYDSDEDIQLVGDALPFGMKLIESLLADIPRHKGLLLAACKGFSTYSYVYVQQEADRVAETDLGEAAKIRTRARKLYGRARGYCDRVMDIRYPGMKEALLANPKTALAGVKKKDVPLLYWSAASLGLGISVSRSDASMLARMPEVEALVERGIQLEEGWNDGAIHEFQVILAGAKPGGPDFNNLKKHFDRALEFSQGKHAGLFVAYAEAVAIPQQDRKEFRALLEKGLAIDPDEYKDVRLANLVAQQRARRLLENIDNFILNLESESPEENP